MNMDIRHLRYFIAIVENAFNLTKTSQILYISQPTLSMMITEFEMTEGVQIFNRKKGKIIGLTYLGENYYNDAKDVIHRYTQMKQNLDRKSTRLNSSHANISYAVFCLKKKNK